MPENVGKTTAGNPQDGGLNLCSNAAVGGRAKTSPVCLTCTFRDPSVLREATRPT